MTRDQVLDQVAVRLLRGHAAHHGHVSAGFARILPGIGQDH
jgi:hypothetical protein